eukprot:snap_masked-scaffold_9-processed-gene-13.27-mRNA-1 protein AED:1.00 eAED:1.00 QI:0/0/0/0/1/1/3/0/129
MNHRPTEICKTRSITLAWGLGFKRKGILWVSTGIRIKSCLEKDTYIEGFLIGGEHWGRWMKSLKTDLLNGLQDIYRSYPTMHKIILWLIMRYMVFNSIYSIWLYEDVFEGFLLNYNEDVDRGCCEVSTV